MLILRAILVSACSIGLLGCSKSKPKQAPPVTAQQQAQASKDMKLAFPPSTKYLVYYEENGLDASTYLKIELSADDLATFLLQPPLAGTSWETDGAWQVQNEAVPDWSPQKVAKFRFQSFLLPNAEALKVLIDDTNEQSKIVYLKWFST